MLAVQKSLQAAQNDREKAVFARQADMPGRQIDRLV
jgi:hypothetical protein